MKKKSAYVSLSGRIYSHPQVQGLQTWATEIILGQLEDDSRTREEVQKKLVENRITGKEASIDSILYFISKNR
jgi:hypothetical protein